VRFGTSKFARLKRLKISHRSSSRPLFEIRTFLATAKSTFTYPGESAPFRSALPNVNGSGSAKHPVSNHSAAVCGAF
jgi:hypothetical protein